MGHKEKNCECMLCALNKKMDDILNRRDPDEMASFIKELSIMWSNEVKNRTAYYASIIDAIYDR
jgi:hypothetical protein